MSSWLPLLYLARLGYTGSIAGGTVALRGYRPHDQHNLVEV
jgi:hypothetical protein